MRRFFKATDGDITVFRASATKFYHSANFSSDQQVAGGPMMLLERISFSQYDHVPGHTYPAEEIVQSEYATLVARKNSRIKAHGDNREGASPQESWVRNAALALIMALSLTAPAFAECNPIEHPCPVLQASPLPRGGK